MSQRIGLRGLGLSIALTGALALAAPGASGAIRLKPRRQAQQRRIAAALQDGKRVTARVKVKFTDGAGSRVSKSRAIRLR